MVHHDRCPLCSSEMIAFYFSCTDHFITRETFAIARCGSCGFLFTQDHPDENEISGYYESPDYISHSDTSEGIVNKIYHIIRQLMLQRKKSLVEKLTGMKNGSLLDIGSGTGHFASAMQNAGWTVTGIEINEKARSFASSAFNLRVIAPDLISGLKAESFDCATLWHVLEHFNDPHKYISDILALLKPGGICLVALPNCSSFDAKHYRSFWAAFDVPRHLWHFDPRSFNRFAQNSGLNAEGRRILPFDVFYISALSEKYKGSALPFITGITKAIWFSFLTFFNRTGSSSVIYILRKPKGQ
jgi:SAM-dependent methyltransferase